MNISNRRESLTLLVGDFVVFIAALWLMLVIRYGEIPSAYLFQVHLVPFFVIFIFWLLVFFIAGLYGKHTTLFKSRLPTVLFNAQIVNSVIAVLFFYFLPYFGINPRANLFIYLAAFFFLILGWRLYGSELLGFKKREKAILIGSGEEMKELLKEVNGNQKYSIFFVASLDIGVEGTPGAEKKIFDTVKKEKITSVVIDLQNEKVKPILPKLYDMVFSRIKFIDLYKVYEDTFDRIPLSILGYGWFLENLSRQTHPGYDLLKRLMDVFISLIFGIVSLVFYPFVFLAIKLDDGGQVFITQERIGQDGKIIRLIKFRSMKANDTGVWPSKEDSRVTSVGKFLRKTRIDELPQLWNVLKGDISTIGPRPDIIGLGKKLSKEIPYYEVRNLIKPGLSGWAQIKQDFPPHSIEETKIRLSYDLYYFKNRSFMLDLRIALQTIKTLLSRSGK